MKNNDHRPTILVVDDSPNDIRLMGKILAGDYHVRFASNGQEAMEYVVSTPPDLMLLDIMMPGMDGLTVCSMLRSNDLHCKIPVIIFTENNDAEMETRGFASGAVDFLTKPVNPPSVRARVAVHLALKKQCSDLEKEIQERRRLEEQLRELAEFDTLTGLPNRKLFNDRLQQGVLMGERNQRNFALLFVDLDRFKWVNDTLGHDAGDTLLIEVALRLKNLVRKSDTVARLGGDEFTVILAEIVHESMAELVARKILEQLSMPFTLKGQEVVISGSVGIGIYPGDGVTAQELAKNSDCAMYQAKASGRNTFQFFSKEINQLSHKRMRLEADMRHACQENEFFLDYQPKINLATGQICGMEALLRWEHPRDGILFPNQFIPLAEGTGLIIQIGAWVLRTACREAAFWSNNGFPALKLAINLSAMQFREGDKLVELVEDALAETDFSPHNLELEITETMMMSNTEQVCATLQKFRAMGITIAMDDFGTGYSSLALLKRLPIQVIKIDRSFVSDLKAGSNNTAFVAAIISMAQMLNLHVVVEGVETAEQLAIMKNYGNNNVQGFFFSPPLGKDGFFALLQGRIPLGGGNQVMSQECNTINQYAVSQ